MKFDSLVSQTGKPLSPSEAVANRPTKWIAERFGVSRRTAQRWKAGTQQPADRGGRRERVMKSADADTRRKVAADAFRGASLANVGRIAVVDKSPRKGAKPGRNFRNVGAVQLNEHSRELMDRAAQALEDGDARRAESLMSDAVMHSYGNGADSALSVADWPAHFDLT